MATAVIVDAVRTAGGKRNGKLSGWHPADLAGEVLKQLVERNQLDPALIDDVIMGCVMQVGNQGLNIGRNAVLAAGFPESVPATSVDRQCGSSQQAAHFAAQGVIAGAYDIAIAAGVEVMTTTPMGASMTPGSLPVRPPGPGPLHRPGPRAPGHLGRDDRRQVGPLPRGARRLRRRVPAAGRAGHRRGSLRQRDRRGHREAPRQGDRQHRRERRAGHQGRGHPPRHHGRDARQPEAGLQARRQGHRRQLVADLRRRLRRAHHERGEGQGARPHPAGPLPHLRPGRASTR